MYPVLLKEVMQVLVFHLGQQDAGRQQGQTDLLVHHLGRVLLPCSHGLLQGHLVGLPRLLKLLVGWPCAALSQDAGSAGTFAH